ncbi:hypothetical protein VP01_4119g1 [Puccinia sorghi]|uniref:Uncharacterized protein n=1 Tax=Puccinia sorghi TaxID=27349 RepID=A0A0L6UR86_9BASI|nr:hypothetical protein VP01_4119g1 [Puccinia sorghi]
MANGNHQSTKKVVPTEIPSKIYDNWLDHLTKYPPYESAKFEHETSESQSNNKTILKPMVVLQSSLQDAQNKNYTVEESHTGNSYIHVRLGEKNFFGSIQATFATEKIPNAINTTDTLINVLEVEARKRGYYPSLICSNGGGEFVGNSRAKRQQNDCGIGPSYSQILWNPETVLA